MRLIAHRGNISGPKPEFENNPEYIVQALDKGFDVEIDVWIDKTFEKSYDETTIKALRVLEYDSEIELLKTGLFLGHKHPTYKVSKQFFYNPNIWCHLKDIEAVQYFQKNLPNTNWFWHENDQLTLTSKGYVWGYQKLIIPNSVVVMPDYLNIISMIIAGFRFTGICADNILEIKEVLEKSGFGDLIKSDYGI